jgi:dihydrodipicolinate synthase/N-acetylneuraminate lyase
LSPEPDRAPTAHVGGLIASAVTPVDVSGAPDLAAFDRIVDFLVDAGVDGVCVGGATAEYPHFDVAERKLLIDRALPRLPASTKLLVGIGCPSPRRTLDLGRYAMDAGAHAVLLPMPLFFRYEQSDLRAFCSDVAATLAAPCLLYDLPEFTNPIDPDTAIDLLRSERFIVGIKDSSGRPERIERFVEARGSAPWSLIVGDDRCLRQGLAAGWTGGISGVAGFCPELLVALHRACAGRRPVRRPPERADRSDVRLSDAMGHPARPRGTRHRHRPAAAAAHTRAAGASGEVHGVDEGVDEPNR